MSETKCCLEIEEINEEIHRIMRVIPHCVTRKEAEELQEDIIELEEQRDTLKLTI